MLKSRFCDTEHSKTFILPNTKQNMFTYHVLNQKTNSTFLFLKLKSIQAKISFLRQEHSKTFISPNTKQTMFTYHVLNQGTISTFSFIKFAILISLFCDKGHFNTLYLPNLDPNRFKYHVSHQGTSRDNLNLHIYQTCFIKSHFCARVIPILSFYRIQNQIG